MIFSKIDNLSTRDKGLIVLAIGLLIVLAVDRFVVERVVSSVQTTKMLIVSDLKSLDYNEKVIACSGGVEEDFAKIAGKLGAVTNPDSDIDLMKGEIYDLAKGADLLLTSMKHREPRPDKGAPYIEYIVDIGGFEGTEESLLKFLDSVQRSELPGLLRVVHLSIGAGRKANSLKGAMTITKVMIMREDDA